MIAFEFFLDDGLQLEVRGGEAAEVVDFGVVGEAGVAVRVNEQGTGG